jgi:hypothetical protein
MIRRTQAHGWLLGFCGLALSLGCGRASDFPPPPEIKVPHADVAPSLEKADDPAWARAAVISSLTQGVGGDYRGPLPKTEVRILWSADALYVRFQAQDPSIETPFSARDADDFKGDVAEVFLDPAGMQKAWYEFEVTPRNGSFDAVYLCTGEPRFGSDGVLAKEVIQHDYWKFKEWNCEGLRTAAWITPDGWVVELAIPPTIQRTLGKPAFRPGVLRANFLRYDVGSDHPGVHVLENWSPVVLGRPHVSPARMGFLRLLPGH